MSYEDYQNASADISSSGYPQVNWIARHESRRQAFLRELRSLVRNYSDVVNVKDDEEYNYYHHVELELPID